MLETPEEEPTMTLETGEPGSQSLVIDCEMCSQQNTEACEDCVVTYFCSRDDAGAVVIDVREIRAIRALSDAGLVPRLRHERRSTG
ncbi:MAG: hypothetical protein N2037_05690 [Acidimicrobiales bacterium]|nr:hypothetical protein [Acidimicrobiales bacterium]